MKNIENVSREVDQYLDGLLDEKSEQLFEEQLKHDSKLADELHHQKQIDHILHVDRDVIELERQLNTIYKQTYSPLKKVIPFRSHTRKILLKATSIAAGIALVTYAGLNLVNTTNSSAELFNVYYKPAEMNMSFRAAEDLIDSELRRAMELYENEDYIHAIPLFEKILKADDTRIGLNLYTGISHMEIEQYDEANQNFRNIIDHEANAFVESAEWYLGLCYLKTNKKDKASELFDQIISQKGYYYKEAKKIKRKIK